MLFNTLTFLIFFVVVLATYKLLRRRHRAQNTLLLVSSYVFYGWWDWRFLGLIFLSTLVDFVVSHKIGAARACVARQRRWLGLSLVANLGMLGIFKYYDFFARSLATAMATLGWDLDVALLQVTLPIGISFYTFQTLSYSIDVYRGVIAPCRRFDDFALFVCFFPQLVAGPIERAGTLLGQIQQPRSVSPGQVELGIWLILWGLFKKMVIADRLAPIADDAFLMRVSPGFDVLLGALAFTFQIYGDFSGYTDVARGVAKLLGFDLALNFRIPYLALSPSDFWSRWHISLSTWLRDYLYIPLGGNRGRKRATYRNLFLTMLLGGLWHGAAWNFVIWGAYHGLLLIAFRPFEGSSGAHRLLRLPIMFALTVVGWIIFRSPDLATLGWMMQSLGVTPSAASGSGALRLAALIAPLLVVWFFQARSGDLAIPLRMPLALRALLLLGLALVVLLFGLREQTEFIYFQF